MNRKQQMSSKKNLPVTVSDYRHQQPDWHQHHSALIATGACSCDEPNTAEAASEQ
jgi:hypothetical protein